MNDTTIKIPNFDVENTTIWYIDENNKVRSGWISSIKTLLDDDEITYSIIDTDEDIDDEVNADDFYLTELDAKIALNLFYLEKSEYKYRNKVYYADNFIPARNFREETVTYPSYVDVIYQGQEYVAKLSHFHLIQYVTCIEYKFSEYQFAQPLVSKMIEIGKKNSSKSQYVNEFYLQYKEDL